MANNPELLKMPLARDGQKSTIPETTDASTGLFSQQYGWQSINSLPPQAGGKAVKREDFNGAFNLLGGIAFMAQKGFTFKWSAEQDYYAGCVVIDDTDGLRYECIADVTANGTAPSADATHWRIFKAGTDIDAWFRQASTAYAVGDMRCYASLPYGWYLECTTAGTTGGGGITLPDPLVENATIADGAVVWTIRKIGSGGDGAAVGDIKQIAYNGTVQQGWLLCDGSAVSRTMFPDLFAAIGTTYGAGDGSTTFNVPDYNAAKRFAQGDTVAGTVKAAGLPNIEGALKSTAESVMVISSSGQTANGTTDGAMTTTKVDSTTGYGNNPMTRYHVSFDASASNPIYGNSDTVQPNALTARYIIKAFDGQTADSALIDITQYAQELAGKANINGSNLVHHRDVITTSGTYTAPATGLYKITVKGGGGGGGGARNTSSSVQAGAGGGEGGTTIGYENLTIGDSVSVVIGAGGAGGAVDSSGGDGGNSSVTINSTTYTGGGGLHANNDEAGLGGSGTINGAPGAKAAPLTDGSGVFTGGSGGGAGGAVSAISNQSSGTQGGGGAGGAANGASPKTGGAGGDGYVWFEYYTPGA